MKSFLSILFILILLPSCSNDQDKNDNNVENGFTIRRSTNIDDLQLDGITEIKGSVHVINTELSNLEFLSQIKNIEGDLIVFANHNLTSLEGLRNLEQVKSIDLSSNFLLRNINVLQDLIINEDLLIQKNDLEEIPVLNFTTLQNVIIEEKHLLDLNFLQHLNEITGDLFIMNSDSLSNLDGLSNLISIDENLMITQNPQLTDFCGLRTCLINSSLNQYEVKDNGKNPSIIEIITECE